MNVFCNTNSKIFRACRRTIDTGAFKIGQFHSSINRNTMCYCSAELPALESKGCVQF